MNELVQAVATRAAATGETTDPTQIESGLGLLFHEMHERLDPATFAQVTTHLPAATGMAEGAARRLEAGGSGGGLTGMIGGLFGGDSGEMMQMISKARTLGLDVSTASALLPIALDVLGDRLPAPLMAKIRALIPSGATSKGGGLLGGLFG